MPVFAKIFAAVGLAILLAQAPMARAQDAPIVPENAATGRADQWPGTLGMLMQDLLGRIRARNWTAAGMVASTAQSEYAGTMLGPWLAGTVELSQGDAEAAERHFREAQEIAPRSHRAITSLIAVWSRLKGPSWSGEQLLKLWEQYGTYVIASVVVVIAGIGGFKYYEHRRTQAAEAAGARFTTAAREVAQNKKAEAKAGA